MWKSAACAFVVPELFGMHKFDSEVHLISVVCEGGTASGPEILSMYEQEVSSISVGWVSTFALFGAETTTHSLDNSAVFCCTGDTTESVLLLS